jgi:hypothetical protein
MAARRTPSAEQRDRDPSSDVPLSGRRMRWLVGLADLGLAAAGPVDGVEMMGGDAVYDVAARPPGGARLTGVEGR